MHPKFPNTRNALFVVLLFALLAGCGPSQTKLTAADNGRQIAIQAGEELVISLDGNPTTGYTWETKDLDTSLFQQVGETAFTSSNPGLVGSGGTQSLTLKALKAGTASLTLVYHRPWETVAPLQTFSVTVTIK